MKTTGIIRTVDELGRIVLPKPMRMMLEIDVRDEVEVITEGDRIVIQKHQPCCVFCGSDEDVLIYSGKRICKACIEGIKQMD